MRFGPPETPKIIKQLMIANLVVFVAQQMLPSVSDLGSVRPSDMWPRGYLWQPFTYMWLHGGMAHLFFNMFALWMFGGQVEQAWGGKRFLRFYLTCGVGAGFVILTWNAMTVDHFVPTLGASGAVYGILMAFSLLWPDRRIMLLFPPIPMKAIWFIPFLFVMQIMMGGGGNISHAGHLGGVIVAIILMRDQFRSYFNFRSLSYRWHRYRMRGRLRSVRREEWDRRRRNDDDDDRPTTMH